MPSMRRALLTALWLLAGVPPAAGDLRVTPDHPRLLIHRDDLAALRKRCGVADYRNAEPAEVRFAESRTAFDRVRQAADRVVKHGAEAGELYAPALAHLVLGRIGRRDAYTEAVERELAIRAPLPWRQDDTVMALDWCWDALDPKTRATAVARLAERMEAISDRISPWDHLAFHPRICDAALAVVLHGYSWPEELAAHAARIEAILKASCDYLDAVFVRLWDLKGPAGTSPTEAAYSEADACLYAEVLQTGAGIPVWPRIESTITRSMQSYFWQHTGHPALPFGFPRDDGNWAPDRPGAIPENWSTAVPWIVAARTGCGVAQWFIRRFPQPLLTGPANEQRRNALAWPQVLYGHVSSPEVFRHACPLGRRVPNGFVLMRTDWSRDAMVLLADAGQPVWRSRQACDAGHFQIFRSGRLTTGSGEDVFFDAAPAHGGDAFLGDRACEPDLFASSTLAHNCVTVHDPAQVLERFGRLWPVPGNQRFVERDYRPKDSPAETADRSMGRLFAFETNSFYTYAAADLAPAYRRETVKTAVRHWLLLNGGLLLICDRIVTVRPGIACAWHLQLPERPEIDGRDLSESDRMHGVTNKAGLWTVRSREAWLSVVSGEGRLFVRTLLPADASRFVLGGPKEAASIHGGPWARQLYFGGSAEGYEHRIWPASMGLGPQAWYRLGTPLNLGPQFGLRSNWGRLDVAPRQRSNVVVFLHALVATDAGSGIPPRLIFERAGDEAKVTANLSASRTEITWRLAHLDGDDSPAGRVRISALESEDTLFQSDLTTRVEPDAPLPGQRPREPATAPATQAAP